MRPRLPALEGPRVHEFLRVVLLLLCGGVSIGADGVSPDLAWVLPLALIGYFAAQPSRIPVLAVALEGLAAGAAVATTGAGDSPFLPYLIAPAFTGGLVGSALGGLLPVGAASITLLVSPFVVEDAPSISDLSSALAQWVVLAAVVAAVAAWVRAVLRTRELTPDLVAAQNEAFRLLTELRTVARQLPGTLDPETSAEGMLDRARSVCRFDAGAVLVASGGSKQLTLVARYGHSRPQWELSLREDSPLAEAWMTQRSQVLPHALPRTDGSTPRGSGLVVPLLSGPRTYGLVVLESGVAQGFGPHVPAQVANAVEGLALQLQTGLVFDEVRDLATHEERRRLAREIHDGIAQELASLAYVLDDVAVDVAAGRPVIEQVDGLRDEVRRLVSELRMSLFDLRSEVDPDEGLGAAIGRHVRTVGTASGMTVHLSLNEAPVRLPAETEAELLRIVQEAVTNARKHAGAENLWVSCTVDPPAAALSVEDDGRGVAGPAGAGSHGLAIMQERAARIRAELSIEPRLPRGTRVRLTLGRVRS